MKSPLAACRRDPRKAEWDADTRRFARIFIKPSPHIRVYPANPPAIPNSDHLPCQTSGMGRGYTRVCADFYEIKLHIRVYLVNPRPIL